MALEKPALPVHADLVAANQAVCPLRTRGHLQGAMMRCVQRWPGGWFCQAKWLSITSVSTQAQSTEICIISSTEIALFHRCLYIAKDNLTCTCITKTTLERVKFVITGSAASPACSLQVAGLVWPGPAASTVTAVGMSICQAVFAQLMRLQRPSFSRTVRVRRIPPSNMGCPPGYFRHSSLPNLCSG